MAPIGQCLVGGRPVGAVLRRERAHHPSRQEGLELLHLEGGREIGVGGRERRQPGLPGTGLAAVETVEDPVGREHGDGEHGRDEQQ